MKHLKTPHCSVQPMVQEGLSTGWRFSPSSAAREGTGGTWSAQSLCEGWRMWFVVWFFFSGHVSHGLIYGKIISWGFTMVIPNPAWTNPPTHLHRHPLWPGSAWDFNILHARRMHGGMLPLLWQAFPCQKSLSSLLWEVGSSPHGRCAPVCYLNPDGTCGKKCGCGGRLW